MRICTLFDLLLGLGPADRLRAGRGPLFVHSTSSRFRILPLAVSGNASSAMKYSGMSYFESPSRVADARAAPCRRPCRPRAARSARHTRSPSRASATGNAAALSTAGCLIARFSMSRGMDVVAAADDEVLLASDDLQVAALVEAAEVAAHEPAAGVERVLGRASGCRSSRASAARRACRSRRSRPAAASTSGFSWSHSRVS